MTLDKSQLWLREHSGMVAFKEVIGRYDVKVQARVGWEWFGLSFVDRNTGTRVSTKILNVFKSFVERETTSGYHRTNRPHGRAEYNSIREMSVSTARGQKCRIPS